MVAERGTSTMNVKEHSEVCVVAKKIARLRRAVFCHIWRPTSFNAGGRNGRGLVYRWCNCNRYNKVAVQTMPPGYNPQLDMGKNFPTHCPFIWTYKVSNHTGVDTTSQNNHVLHSEVIIWEWHIIRKTTSCITKLRFTGSRIHCPTFTIWDDNVNQISSKSQMERNAQMNFQHVQAVDVERD